ncbi:hypothetical protein [Escherichia coli]|nr:hypothetical protein [Escherichia coli]
MCSLLLCIVSAGRCD